MKVYTFQLPKWVSGMARGCVKLFRRDKKEK
ncbi:MULTISPECIES: stage V sporulation protein SpoVM [Solibacillus]|uniref:Stage V sporulation protein SpoVM n=1 Tax=Solibacillus palustris TaxID=2908203 RepID=A0ABS9U994_9BACL|nr:MULTISPECIES: stage V sporulation protein SpoVM [Solibacillus]MCH7320891.1 stage V sporulation protein SpoVM [Solibacillus sp. MA9]